MSLVRLRHLSGPINPVATAPLPDATRTATSKVEPSATPARDRNRSRPVFMQLPTEIHILIARLLLYPDALSLKHASRYLYGLVDTGVALKVEWLVLRRSLKLHCPNDCGFDLASDRGFCRGSVPLLLLRHRYHLDCETKPGIGCMTYSTAKCRNRHSRMLYVRRRMAKFFHQPSTLAISAMVLVLGMALHFSLGWMWFSALLCITTTAIFCP